MRQKRFEEVRNTDDQLRAAVIKALDGEEPDNAIESEFGAVITGPPDPKAAESEKALVTGLDKRLAKHMQQQKT